MMLTLNAPAKINWFLTVIGKRNDGFHEIQSLIQKITLYDVLRFSLLEETADPGLPDRITPINNIVLETSAPIATEQNLVYKAAMR